jgi:transposase
MMGPRQVDQAALFYEFSLEQHVPATHMLRSIDRFVDLSDVRNHLAPFYSSTGRPSIDPELLVRMLLVGYCYGIRSERRLCEEVHLNLAYRWFCRLGLDGEVPDHSTFSKNRHGRFRDCDLLRKLFETVVRRCMAEGLVDGAAFAVDASLIAADANKQRSAAGSDDVDWEAIARTRRSVREYLDTLDEAAWGAASETVPKFISRSDPAAQWTGAHKGHAFFAYADNYLIDLKAAIIVDVEATRAIRQAEVGAARTMIERTEDRLGLCPERLAADSAYGSAEMLGWLVNERAIEPHIPVFDKSARDDGTFSRGDFSYNQEADIYVCPAGKVLTSTGTLVNDGATLLYRGERVLDAMVKLLQDQLLQLVGCLALAGIDAGLSEQTPGIDFGLRQQQSKADILRLQKVVRRRPAFRRAVFLRTIDFKHSRLSCLTYLGWRLCPNALIRTRSPSGSGCSVCNKAFVALEPIKSLSS